ncbi:hypothetical protein CTEN210_06704 [Chaetoceros tenuissimus]|uniref:PiggyBac transposable element-derived protein domain-containing protein n=1 Tax=Chaetoceros tenuissimus TaxID=426638 RepID=A0AAD3CQD8_9STRA|nr:hypothetical protein CTEN210_06704 [Chaetoceros tenuissimus]
MAKTTPRIESYELGSVWTYLKKTNLNGAHNSLVDAKAQTDIVISSQFMPYLERKRSYRSISNIWSATEQSEMKKKLESIREVHEPWTELEPDSNTWTPPRRNQYDGPNGGGVRGPSTYITNIMYRQGATLATLFLALFPLTIFERIVKHTNFYAYKENVKLVDAFDRDGKLKKKRQFVSCDENDPERRTRVPMKIFEATVGYVIAWFGILIWHGAQCPGRKLKYWKKSPRGLPQAFIQNTMSFKAFEFLRRYIHFEDNRNAKPKTNPLFDPLWKIRWALDSVSNNIRKAYNAGKDVTIDESMIRYRGRAVSFVQYMPKKPIKHGIKVFALCCAVTAYLLGFEVYLGKEFTRSVESTAINVVERLIVEADLVKAKGRTLYTDNWYTSMDLAKHLYENHGWTLVGTITPTDKKARSDHDVPFLKLSNGGLKAVPRGWYREAIIEIKSANNNRYCIQCTTWRDKKQVMFLHTKLVGPSVAHQVKRHVKGKQQRVDLSAPSIQKEYAANFNAVDRNDSDSAHHTCSIRTNRWYLRIKFWLLDRVVFSCYILVCEMAQDEACPYKDDWKKYLDKNEGRENFQIDLGLALISYRIEVNRSRDGCVKLSSSRVNVKSASSVSLGKQMESFMIVLK